MNLNRHRHRSPSHVPSVRFVLACAAVAAAGLTGCVDMEDHVAFTPSSAAPPAVTDPVARCNTAEPPLGLLRGEVYALPQDTRLLPDVRGMRTIGTVCTDALAITERRSFPGVHNRGEWFAVDFQGTFYVATAGLYRFRLTSDDGSKLAIDGAVVIDNDGYHVARTLEGSVNLTVGTHGIAVPYWQGPGPLALVLEVARSSDGGGDGTYTPFLSDRPLGGSPAVERPQQQRPPP